MVRSQSSQEAPTWVFFASLSWMGRKRKMGPHNFTHHHHITFISSCSDSKGVVPHPSIYNKT